MSSLAISARGTLIQVETAEGSGVYTSIPEVGAIAGPNAQSSEFNVNTHDTPGNTDETLVGMVNPGSVSFPINIVPANALHKQLRNDKFALTQRNYKLLENTGEFTTFRGMVKGFNKNSPVDGSPRKADVEVRILGPVTFSD